MSRARAPRGALRLACVSCGAESPPVTPASPAAPILTACEALERAHGWTFEIGFFAMLTGDHRPRCAACSAALAALAGGDS